MEASGRHYYRVVVATVGVNAVFLQPQMGGIETYVRELYPAMLEAEPRLRLSIFVSERGRRLLADEPWSSEVELVTHPLLGRRYTQALTETTILGWIASRRRLDVLHSVALTAPLRTRPANVVTVADVTWLRQPEAVGRATSLLWRTLVIPAARRADRLITLSKTARDEIAEDFRIAADRIDVVPCGRGTPPGPDRTDEQELRRRLGLGDGPLVLAVSALSPHKNVGALVEALPAVRRTRPDAVLVVPGNPTPYGERLAARAADLGVGEALELPGWVTRAELEGLYRAASCFVFPSLREGFGLPVLEAMERGVPVACSNTSAVPEVAGDAALYFDPRSPAEIAAAVTRLLGDSGLAADLARRGHERVKQFSWRKAAEQTLESYERALV